MTAGEVIGHFGLEYLEGEGGYYRRIYVGPHQTPSGRPIGSSILYLVTPESFSALHRLGEDELWHFCMGDAAEQLLLHPDASGEIRILGSRITEGHQLVSVVPGGCWQAARLLPGGSWALFGVTMPIAYDPQDFTIASAEELSPIYPDYRDTILSMTSGG